MWLVACHGIPAVGGFRRALSPPLMFTPPLQLSPRFHSHSLRLHWTRLARCFPPVAVWTMFACRAAWQRCGPLARQSLYRAQLNRDGEHQRICLIKFHFSCESCNLQSVLGFNCAISHISTIAYNENVLERAVS